MVQEVCGLAWSPDGDELASGGNDNSLCVWDARKGQGTPVHRCAAVTAAPSRCDLLATVVCAGRYTAHTAAVKAMAWSPHRRRLLCSGGGTADRCIRFWVRTRRAYVPCRVMRSRCRGLIARTEHTQRE